MKITTILQPVNGPCYLHADFYQAFLLDVRNLCNSYGGCQQLSDGNNDFCKSSIGIYQCRDFLSQRGTGAIFQCRPFNRTCGRAGSSKWATPETGIMHIGLNACSSGIELAYAGDSFPALSWARKQPGFESARLRHKNGGDYREWESYPLAQLQACEEVSKALVARYRRDDLLGHEDCSPNRKVDPGPCYPIQALRNACRFLEPLGKLKRKYRTPVDFKIARA